MNIYLLFLRRCCGSRIELVDILFALDAMLFDCKLLLLWCWIEFSLFPCKLFPTATLDAPSNRSFKLSPTIRKFGKRIQHVLTVHDPDIPWHLHSCRISLWTCWNQTKIKREKNHQKTVEQNRLFLAAIISSRINVDFFPWNCGFHSERENVNDSKYFHLLLINLIVMWFY